MQTMLGMALCIFATCVPCLAEDRGGMPPAAVTVVIDDNYPPYIFRDSNGQLQGILKDIWALWASRTGIRVEFKAMDWGMALQSVLEGDADVIDTLFRTEEREKVFSFSAPYARIEVPVFFHRNIGGIVDAASLRGFTVGVKEGDACIEHLEKHGITSLKKYPSYEELIASAASQEIRIFCADKPPAMYFLFMLGIDKDFRHSAPLYAGQFHRAYARGNDTLKKIVEDGFSGITETELKQIEARWFGSPLERNVWPVVRVAVYALMAVVALTLLLFVWNHALRRRVVAKTSELSSALDALGESKRDAEKTLNSLTATLEAIPDLFFEIDSEGRYVACNAMDDKLMTVPAGLIPGRTVGEVLPPEAAAVVMDALREASEKGVSHGAQYRLDSPGGSFWFELSVARKKPCGEDGERFVVLARDVTERKCAEIEIEQLAFFDTLTKLPNRRFLADHLHRGLAACARRGAGGAVLLIDLDDFRNLNDIRGHRIGDRLLIEVARRLQSFLRLEDCVARQGGDEFVIVLEDLGSDPREAATEAENVGHKVLDRIAEVYYLEGVEYHCTASIGVTLFREEDSVDELLKRADAAMYRAKMAGRNTLRFFDPAMQTALEARASLEMELRRALPDRQLEIFLQEQVNREGRIVGVEVLLRWRHPVRGLVSPMKFIPLAEETGLIVPIGHWVLEMACAQLKKWEANPLARELRLAVNVSARQFRQPDFVLRVRSVILSCGIDPSRLTLELTESMVLDNMVDSVEKMQALRSMGVCFSLDDFGTGYSSLAYLKRLPFDELKIDGSFVRDVTTDQSDAVIAQTIIVMARNFGLRVVAECVETRQQMDFLLDNGCMEFQGYLFSPPMTVAEFEARLASLFFSSVDAPKKAPYEP